MQPTNYTQYKIAEKFAANTYLKSCGNLRGNSLRKDITLIFLIQIDSCDIYKKK